MSDLISALVPLTRSNAAIVLLGFLCLGLLVMIVIMVEVRPEQLAARVRRRSRSGRAGRFAPVEDYLARILSQLDLVRRSETPVGVTFRRQLFRDGTPSSIIEHERNDFFEFVQLATGLFLGGLAAFLVIGLSAPPFFLALAGIGYLAPPYVANYYNNRRRLKILAELPNVLSRMQTRVATPQPGGGIDYRGIFAAVGGSGTGPLYAEFMWAANQLAVASQNKFDVIRRLDERNNIEFFAPLAQILERETSGSAKAERQAFELFIQNRLDEVVSERNKRLEGVSNKVSGVMTPFLLFALILSVVASFLIKFATGG